MMKIEKKIKEIIEEILEDCGNVEGMSEKLKNPECDLIDDLGLDSLLLVQMIVEVENVFDFNFELMDLDVSKLRKFLLLRDCILKWVSEQSDKWFIE